ncbi:MAG: biopolymer transporter ExbD [Epsilonproteobacteria bacterium]|nr:biopolymer transporter ExbD [Campylobacterota bacterium]
MLVLLAIVLTTSTLVQKNLIPVDLPKSSSQKELKSKSVAITIDKEGNIYFENSPVSKEEFISKLDELSRDKSILINCDKSSRFENFVFVLDELKKRDFQNLSIVTENE